MDETYVVHAFGRVEGKLDKLSDQVGSMSQTVAEYGVRLSHLEAAVAEQKISDHGPRIEAVEKTLADQKAEAVEAIRSRVTLRGAWTVGLTTVMMSGIGSWIVAVITK